MTYGRVCFVTRKQALRGAAVSHSAELVRGTSLLPREGPLIRPFGPPSPQGEKELTPLLEDSYNIIALPATLEPS